MVNGGKNVASPSAQRGEGAGRRLALARELGKQFEDTRNHLVFTLIAWIVKPAEDFILGRLIEEEPGNGQRPENRAIGSCPHDSSACYAESAHHVARYPNS